MRRYPDAFFTLTLPAYGIACVAILLTGIYGIAFYTSPLSNWLVPTALFIDAAMVFLVVYIENQPRIVILPALIAAWAIALSDRAIWRLIMAYSLLCVGIFIMQYVWRALAKLQGRQQSVPSLSSFSLLATGGQILVVLFSIDENITTLQATIGQSGVIALFIAGGLIAASGYAQQKTRVRFWCNYVAGLLCVLAMTWDMIIVSNYSLPMDLLTIIPSSYLLVTTPFFLRERQRLHMQQAGYMIATVGALALLLPSFLQSFSDQGVIMGVPSNLAAAFLLLAETLALLLLGVVIKERFFVLGGCALVVVAALRVFFYAITEASPLAVLAMVIAGLSIVGVAIFLVVHQRKGAGHAARHSP